MLLLILSLFILIFCKMLNLFYTTFIHILKNTLYNMVCTFYYIHFYFFYYDILLPFFHLHILLYTYLFSLFS